MERQSFVCTGCGEVFSSQEIFEHEVVCVDLLEELFEDEADILYSYMYEDVE